MLQEQKYPHDRTVPKISCHVWLVSVGILNFLNDLAVISLMADAKYQQPNKMPASGGCFSLLIRNCKKIKNTINIIWTMNVPYEKKNEVNNQTSLVDLKQIKTTNAEIT